MPYHFKRNKDKLLYRALSRASFGHTGATEMLDSFIQAIHRDTFKQTRAADPGLHEVFNSTFFT